MKTLYVCNVMLSWVASELHEAVMTSNWSPGCRPRLTAYLTITAQQIKLRSRGNYEQSNSSSACCYAVQDHLLSENVKIKIYTTIALFVVLCGCEMWSFTLREGHRLSVFENGALKYILYLRRVKWREGGENCVRSSSLNVVMIKQGELDGRDM
jgi:hypothetical protein